MTCFRYDWERDVRIKENGKFTFPAKLSVRPYCEAEATKGTSSFSERTSDTETDVADEDLEFHLYSVVIHRGRASGGHYHAYIRDVYGEGIPYTYGQTLMEEGEGGLKSFSFAFICSKCWE